MFEAGKGFARGVRRLPWPGMVLLSLLACAEGQQRATTPASTPEQNDAQWQVATRDAEAARSRWLGVEKSVVAAGPYRADWPSLQRHPTPAWFNDAKFGIFIHWGVFSVPAFGSEWYSRNMYQPGTPEFKHHQDTYGPQASFGYKDFIPRFRMEHFDPAAWAALFRQAGARYVIPVAEHHDGFALYATDLSPWNAVKMGPHRDLVGDLASAVRTAGLKFGVSSHRAEHDWFFDGGRSFPSDVSDPRFAGLYGPAQHREFDPKDDADLSRDYTYVSATFRKDWLARSVELEERYHPDLMYFDWWVGFPDFRESEEQFATFYYDTAEQHDRKVVMFTKYANMAKGAGTLDVERGALSGIQTLPWQTDTSLSNASWGYVEGDTYKTPQMVLDELIDVVSKNGNLLLNIGPRADGSIPEAEQQVLLAVGKWLALNADAIYGSRPWKRFGEGPTDVKAGSFQDSVAIPYTAADLRFTTHDGDLFAIALRPPAQGEVTVHSLSATDGKVQAVSLLGYPGVLQWRQTAEGLHITVPANTTLTGPMAFRIHFE